MKCKKGIDINTHPLFLLLYSLLSICINITYLFIDPTISFDKHFWQTRQDDRVSYSWQMLRQ